ncbi:MAG: hypothetical protein MUE33_11060 [Cytophagaceae bacterium]|jgi:hypothetical protein|nr:hypothetical protein [Cytophagaceae bacterium]
MFRDETIFHTLVQQFKQPENKAIHTVLSQWFNTDQIQQPNQVSIGVLINDTDIPWQRWWEKEQSNIRSCSVIPIAQYNTGMEPRIERALSGGMPYALQIQSQTEKYLFLLQRKTSSRYALKPYQWVELINNQVNPAACWHTIDRLIQEHYKLNNRPSYTAASIQEYIQQEEDLETLDFLLSKLLTEIQVTCSYENHTFIIPTELKETVYKSDNPFYSMADIPEPDFDTGDKEEDKKAKIRYQLSASQWYLKENPNPWEYYFLESFTYDVHIEISKTFDREGLVKSVQHCLELANKHAPGFCTYFEIALFLLNTPFSKNVYTETTGSIWKEKLLQEKPQLPSDSVASFFSESSYLPEALCCSEEKALGLGILQATQVFGGMGSWNDIYIQEDTEYQYYSQWSDALFQGRLDLEKYVLNIE